MGKKDEQWVCAHCGHTAEGKFTGDICPKCGLTYWKCGKCGFLVSAATHRKYARSVRRNAIF